MPGRRNAPAQPPVKPAAATPKPAKAKAPPAPAPLASEPAPGQRSRPGGRLGQLVTLLERPQGATIADMGSATGWQNHSVRGALAGALKSRGYVVVSEKPGVERVYRIASPEPVAAAPRARRARK